LPSRRLHLHPLPRLRPAPTPAPPNYNSYSAYRLRKTKTAGTLAPPPPYAPPTFPSPTASFYPSPTRLSPFHTHHAIHYTFSSCNAAGPATAYPIPQSSDDTGIANLTTAHHHFIPNAHKHRSYLNTANYYLDSTDYRLTKTKTDKLTQRLAEFSYMHTYHSFQSEFCSGCLERLCGITQSLGSYARSMFRIVGTATSAGSLGGRLGSRSALSQPALRLR